MLMLKRLTALAALAVVMLLATACERKITRVEVVQAPQSCFDCHSDQNTFLVSADQQWQNSFHASGRTLNEDDRTCKNCHTSEGYVARAATATSHSVETPGTVENPTSIHCFTCHAPHSNGDFRLRWTAITTLMNGVTYDLGAGNLCASCHQSRRDIRTYITPKPGRTNLTNRFGPHYGPQSDMLIGTGGYQYANYTYEITDHRSATEDGCIDCHKNKTSNSVVGGHSFNMRFTEGTEEIRNVAACEDCHGAIDDFNEVTIGNTSLQDSVEVRLSDLKTILVGANLLDATTDLPKPNSLGADSAGAVYNYKMVEEDRSKGVHNPKYALGLLNSAILYMTGSLPQPVPLAAVSPRR